MHIYRYEMTHDHLDSQNKKQYQQLRLHFQVKISEKLSVLGRLNVIHQADDVCAHIQYT